MVGSKTAGGGESFQGNIHSFTVNQYNEVMKQRNVLSCFLMHCFT